MRIILIDDTQGKETWGFPASDTLSPYIGDNLLIPTTPEEAMKALEETRKVLKTDYHPLLVIIHSSYHEKSIIASVENLYEDDELMVARLEISGGVRSNFWDADDQGGSMKKDTFYKSLVGFLEAVKEMGPDDRDKVMADLVDGRFLESSAPPVAPLIMVDYEGLDERSAISQGKNRTEAWVEHVEKLLTKVEARRQELKKQGVKGYILALSFNLDKLHPAEARDAALYIRLALHKAKKSAFCPFIFYGEKQEGEYITKFGSVCSTDILFCASSYLMTATEDNKSLMKAASEAGTKALDPSTYKTGFLNKIKVVPNEETAGNHSIANYWGAYVLGNTLLNMQGDAKGKMRTFLAGVMNSREPVYLHYLVAQGYTEEELSKFSKDQEPKIRGVKSLPESRGKKVLYIDDQAPIWQPVISALLPHSELTILGNDILTEDALSSEYSINELVENKIPGLESCDLILLDLRLMGDKEENNNSDNLSGLLMLKKIMEINRGLRVIMFTSSNKAWNLERALKHGAAGYYMKEAPGVVITDEETKNNAETLVSTINRCFQTAYLRDMCVNLKTLETEYRDKIPVLFNTDRGGKDMFDRVLTQLHIAFNMLLTATAQDRVADYEFAYIALYQVFEIIKWLDRKYDPNDKNKSTAGAIYNISGQDVKTYTVLRNSLVHKRGLDTEKTNLIAHIKDLWKDILDIINIGDKNKVV